MNALWIEFSEAPSPEQPTVRADVREIILVTHLPVTWWYAVCMCGRRGQQVLVITLCSWPFVFLMCQWQFGMMWPFKVQDSVCLVHQGLTQSSYSTNICLVNETPQIIGNMSLCSHRSCSLTEITADSAPFKFQPKHRKHFTLGKTLLWLKSIKLNIVY